MNFENKMECEIEVYWELENEIGGKITVSNKDDRFQGIINTINSPRNKMESELEIISPEILTNEYTPTQDTFITNYRPTLNYGSNNLLKIGNENGYIYESLIQFDISDIPTNFFIQKAILQLHSDNDKGFNQLNICYPYKIWEENNVVWNGKPDVKEVWKTINFQNGIIDYEIDVTDFIGKWWNKTENNLGLLLKAKNETLNQIINFTSNESSIKPKLIIQYYDKDLFIEENSVMKACIKVQSEEKNDLLGKIQTVFRYGNSGIEGNIITKNKEVIEGFISTNASKEINAQILPHRLNSNLDAEVFSSKELIKGFIKVNAINQLESQVKSQILLNDKISGMIDVNRPLENINGQVLASNSDDTLRGKIVTMAINKIDGNITINAFKRDDLQANLSNCGLKELNSVIDIVCNSGIEGLLKIQPHSNIKGDINIALKSNLESEIRTILKNQIQGSIKSQLTLDNSINGLLNVMLKSQLDGIVSVNNNVIQGEIKNGAINDITGKVKVCALSKMFGKVKSKGINDLQGSIKVNALDINEIDGTIIIKNNLNDEVLLYAFIM